MGVPCKVAERRVCACVCACVRVCVCACVCVCARVCAQEQGSRRIASRENCALATPPLLLLRVSCDLLSAHYHHPTLNTRSAPLRTAPDFSSDRDAGLMRARTDRLSRLRPCCRGLLAGSPPAPVESRRPEMPRAARGGGRQSDSNNPKPEQQGARNRAGAHAQGRRRERERAPRRAMHAPLKLPRKRRGALRPVTPTWGSGPPIRTRLAWLRGQPRANGQWAQEQSSAGARPR